MESKFTHTEWQRAGTTVYALNVEGSNRFSASVQGGWATDGRLRTDDAELVANARLIAAAPELLAVALHCREMLYRFEINRINGDEISSEALALINAAISKATGEQA